MKSASQIFGQTLCGLWVLLSGLTSLCALPHAWASTDVETLAINEKLPLYVLLLTGNDLQTGSISELRVAVTKGLGSQYAIDFLEVSGVEDCDSLTCYLRLVRSHRRPQTEVLLQKFVVLISIEAGGDGKDEVFARLLDISKADGLLSGASLEAVEQRIQEKVVMGRIDGRMFASLPALESLLTGLLSKEFQELRSWDPRGQVMLELDERDLTIILDGKIVGQSSGEPMRLAGLLPTKHRLSLEHPRFEPTAADVVVQTGQTLHLKLQPKPRPQSSLNDAMLIGGLSLTALGLGLSVWAATMPSGSSEVLCFAPSGIPTEACGHGKEFSAFPSSSPGLDPNSGSVLVAPLGYSMALAGGTWLAGSFLEPDSELTSWIVLGIGVVAGAASYGMSAALNGKTGFKP